MKKDKEWAKGQLEYYIKAVGNPFNSRTQCMINAYKNVEHIINQLDEPEKPVIPQFVADYIEYYKGTGITLGTWFNFVNEDEFERKTEEWIYSGSYEENLKREYLLIDAIRYGYEVNKEKKYYIYDKSTKGYLGYNADKTRLSWYTSKFPNDVFTEQEIKEIDERYWAFAQEVTE